MKTQKFFIVGITAGIFLFSAATVSAASCPEGIRTLTRGARGEDVRQYQSFLISEGYLGADSATGFFGQLTEKAVQKWQAKNNIVSSGNPSTTGYGTIGRLTRAVIATACKKGSRTNSARPQRDILNPHVPIGTETNYTVIEPYPSVTAKIISPNGGEEFYEGATTTISYSIQGLPANSEGYTAKLYLKDLVTGSSHPIISTDLIQKIGAVGTASYHISDNLIPDTFDKSFNTYVFEIVVTKSMKRALTDSEIELAKKKEYDIATMPQPTVITKVAVDESDGSFKIYRVSDALLDYSTGYYASRGVITLAPGSIYDLWGGRYLIRLDDLVGNRAHLTTLFDYKPVGQIEVNIGKVNAFSINSIDTSSSNATLTSLFSGSINFKKVFGPGLAEFELVIDPDMPKTLSHVVNGKETVNREPKLGEVWATVQASNIAPFQATLHGSYNLLKLCEKGTKYVLNYGDGQSETMISDSCSPTPYTKVHTYKPGTFAAEISVYKVAENNWTYFLQAEVLITVSSDGSMQFKIIDVFSGMRG